MPSCSFCKNLYELMVTDCFIKEIKGLENLTEIRHLGLGNHISKISNINHLTNLTNLLILVIIWGMALGGFWTIYYVVFSDVID